MKKRIALLLGLIALSLPACGRSDNTDIEELKSRIAELEKENNELMGRSGADEEPDTHMNEPDVNDTETVSNKNELDSFVAETSGVCGENLFWEYGNGILYIHGMGDMSEYEVYGDINHPEKSEIPTPWIDIRDRIAKVIIDSGCTSIGREAFLDCVALSSVEMPNTITRIGYAAFVGCTNLKRVDLPDDIKIFYPDMFCEIRGGGFDSSDIDFVELPYNLESIAQYRQSGDADNPAQPYHDPLIVDDPEQIINEYRDLVTNKIKADWTNYLTQVADTISWRGEEYTKDNIEILVNSFIDEDIIPLGGVEKAIDNAKNNNDYYWLVQYIESYQ